MALHLSGDTSIINCIIYVTNELNFLKMKLVTCLTFSQMNKQSADTCVKAMNHKMHLSLLLFQFIAVSVLFQTKY